MSDGPEGTSAKRRPGRPTAYREEYDEQALKLCRLGMTNDELAAYFEVSPASIDRWIAKRPSFRRALTLGRANADGDVADRLFKRATGYSHDDVHIAVYEGRAIITPIVKHYPPDTTAMIFWLKNRRPDKWREKREEAPADAAAAAAAIRDLLKALDDETDAPS